MGGGHGSPNIYTFTENQKFCDQRIKEKKETRKCFFHLVIPDQTGLGLANRSVNSPQNVRNYQQHLC